MGIPRNFKKLLIANRGEVACRVMRTCREMGIRTVAVYSAVEANSVHAELADESYPLPDTGTPSDGYLDVDGMVELAVRARADAVHPGYGFMSENPEFARACEKAGIAFVGPPARVIEAMANKREARAAIARLGVPVLPGTTATLDGTADIGSYAQSIGYPLMVKASNGGGGIGLAMVPDPDRLERALKRARSTARRAFASDDLYLERYVPDSRHVEVQVVGDGHGTMLHLYERECSVQRRHQKLIEETPSPGLPEETRDAMTDAALTAARGIGYEGVGTFEFLLAPDGAFYFLEANTRLQVEHGITEMTVGVDMVEQQISVASGTPLGLSQAQIATRGHAIECRIYAEDPETFLPSPGTVTAWQMPRGDGVRVETGIRMGDEVTPHFDPLLAKVMAWAESRSEAIDKLTSALEQTRVEGVKTNVPFLLRALASPQFREGRYTTSLADTLTAGAQ